MKPYGSLIAASLITFMLLPPCIVGAAKARLGGSKDHVRQISFSRGGHTATLKGMLRPYSKHIYRFRARGGQEMSIELRFQKEGVGRDGDLVFWVQCRGWYPPGSRTAVLERIDKGGVANWSGILPGTGEYEIYVSNPPIGDHAIRRSLPYKLQMAIK
jgi:hypothetical protein